MKAVLLYAYGDPAQLHYEETDMPKYGDDEVLVKVHATSINPIDLKLRSGAAKSRMPLTLPAILGRDLSGDRSESGDAGQRTCQPVDRALARRSPARAATPCAAQRNRSDYLDFIVQS